MLNIAICDDDETVVLVNETITRECLQKLGIAGKITTYTQSSNLLYDITQDSFFYDLLLLDIEMPQSSGMELAATIRPFLPNVKIIFVTSHIEYAIDAFELSVFRYVPKNDRKGRLLAAVTDALKLLALEDGKVYTIQTNSRLEKIPYREILYIERDGKNVKIMSFFFLSKVRRTLQQIYEELAGEEFIFIDRGCIVNLIHIMQIKDGMVVLKDKTTLPVSRSHLQEVKEQMNRYWGMHI